MVMRAWIAAVLVAASVVWWLPLSAQVLAPVASAPDGAAVFERECSVTAPNGRYFVRVRALFGATRTK